MGLVALSSVLSGCSQLFPKDEPVRLDEKHMVRLMPARVTDRPVWAREILGIMDELAIKRNAQNACSIIAVVDQESNFNANPQVAGLGDKAVREVQSKLNDKFGKTMGSYFENMLRTKPTPDDNYLGRIRKVKTEQELDLVYREMFDYFTQQYHVGVLTGAARLVGENIAENFNPITTLGSMQVSVQYASEHKRTFMSINQLRDELYTRRGGLFYGIHRLMRYNADYDKPLYRFADYNSGMYSSRNAAFQNAINQLTGSKLALDGDLLLYTKDGDPKLQHSSTEDVLITWFAKDPAAPLPRAIRNDLKREKTESFEQTATYQYVANQYQRKKGRQMPYAVMPRVVISGVKLRRDYDTNWYATRVNGRYMQCMQQARHMQLK